MGGLQTWRCHTVIILVAALALAGCGGGSGGSSSASSGASEITMSATQLDFGNVAVQSRSDRSITIQNIGSGPLSLNGSQPAAPFSIFQSDCPTSLAPGASCTVYLRFAPTQQTAYQGSFTLTTNDSDEGVVTIALLGAGKAYNVSINRIINDACPTLKLLVTVTAGAGGAPVSPRLAQGAFSVFEDDAPVAITGFSSVSGLPMSVGLVLDYSSSTQPYTASIETAAGLFVDDMGATDEGELIKFSGSVYQIRTYTTDKASLKAGIGEPFPGVRYGTKLYDALIQSIDHTALRSNISRAVVGISDGNDASSVATLDQVIAEANAKGVPIFMIGIGQVNSVNLQRLAEETGGQYFPYDPATSDLNVIYQTISNVLSEQYLIQYTSPSAGGAQNPVLIDVRVDNAGQQGEDSKDGTGC